MRTLIFFKRYFLDFYDSLSLKTQDKVDYALYILQELEFVPANFVKHITNTEGIYELRIHQGNMEYRILFFFETGSLIEGGKVVILGNGFLKKDNRDYKKAVRVAEKIKQEFFDEQTPFKPDTNDKPDNDNFKDLP